MKLSNTIDNRIGHPLGGRVAGKNRTGTATLARKETKTAGVTQTPMPQSQLRPLPERVDVHNFWAQLSSIQQQTTAAQMSLQLLLRARQILQRYFDSLSKKKRFPDDISLKKNLLECQKELIRLIERGQYQGELLLTSGLQPKVLGYQSIRHFQIKGLDLLINANRDEHLDLILTGQKVRRAGIFLPNETALEQRLAQIKQAFSRLGLRVQVVDNELDLSVNSEFWAQVQGHLYIRGGGVRVPAGNPVKLQLAATISWREPAYWQQQDELQAGKTQEKIKRLAGEISSHIKLLQQMQIGWLEELNKPPSDLELREAEGMVEYVIDAICPKGGYTYAAINAMSVQANMGRTNTLALL